MPRRMADTEFRNQQWLHRFDNHIAPINKLVDELCGEGKMPYVAPIYGGINARLLSVLRDPGPKTQLDHGSGFLCIENDDATAERMYGLIAETGIDISDMLPWNAYPWYINRAPTAVELNAGVDPLKRIIDLLPKLRVVLLHGGTAQNSWKRLTRRYPNIIVERGLQIIATYHTSPKAFWHSDAKVREKRRQNLRESLYRAAGLLNGDRKSEPSKAWGNH